MYIWDLRCVVSVHVHVKGAARKLGALTALTECASSTSTLAALSCQPPNHLTFNVTHIITNTKCKGDVLDGLVLQEQAGEAEAVVAREVCSQITSGNVIANLVYRRSISK